MVRRFAVLLSLFATATFVLAQTHRSDPSRTSIIPAGTPIRVRMIDALDSGKAKPGDVFNGTLETAIVDTTGYVVFPQGSDMKGRVSSVHTSGRLSDPGVLELQLVSVHYGPRSANISAPPLTIKGQSHTGSNVGKIGGGAATGAILGGILGGGKGAAIGAGAGTAAGTTVAAATGKREATVNSEAILDWTTDADVAVGNGNVTPNPTTPTPVSNSTTTDNPAPLSEGPSFSGRDRRVIRDCFRQNASNLPPGLAKRGDLPPGLEGQLQKNGTLPPGLQKRVQSLPQVCEQQLPALPNDLERVVYSGRVMLLDDNTNRILDIFELDE